MHRKHGSNQHTYKYGLKPETFKSIVVILAILFLVCVLFWPDSPVISPLPPASAHGHNITPTPTPIPTVDTLVDTYAKKYGSTPSEENRIKVMLHFLLFKEAGYGSNKSCGDSGRACGPLQFWEATYKDYRKIMIQRGLASEMGDRWDMENAIDTAAWAISDGREEAWGPILRGEIDL